MALLSSRSNGRDYAKRALSQMVAGDQLDWETTTGGGGGAIDDVPLNVVFGEPVSQNRGPRLDSPCRLFCFFAGLGFLHPFAENLEKDSLLVDVLFAKTLEKRVFCGK